MSHDGVFHEQQAKRQTGGCSDHIETSFIPAKDGNGETIYHVKGITSAR